MKKIKVFLVNLFILSAFALNAQVDFQPAYIITNNADTLYGKIDKNTGYEISDRCVFKDEEQQTITYTPVDIKSFFFVEGQYFISKEIDGRMRFIECLIKGNIDAYCMYDQNSVRYFISKESLGLTEIPYVEEYRKVDNEEVAYHSTKHIGVFKYYMQDAPELYPEIDKLKKPNAKSITKLVKLYHQQTCTDELCVVYESNTPSMVFHLEPVLGIQTFKDEKENNMQYGLLVNLFAPRTSRTVFMRLGVMSYGNAEVQGFNNGNIYFPVQIGYMAPSSYKARFSFAVDLTSASYTPAVYFTVGEKIHFSLQSWLNFSSDKSPFLPESLSSYSFLGGLSVRL